MPLPLSPDVTAGPGGQIPSTLANNIQSMIVGARHGSESWLYGAINGNATLGSWTPNGFFVQAAAGTNVWDVGIGKLPVGARITGVSVAHRRAGGTLTFDLIVSDLTGTFSENTTAIASINSGTTDVVTSVAISPVTMALTSHAYIRCTAGAALDRFYACAITFDH